ncbi:MAG TPA: FKBP-type peptidyl-prolyl cis-trans isomerase [Myxococcales bacterium]|nr:FKBP-type peptidyl-prolyl cis-trans isomerase [Myxococcales bacterium]
MRRSTILSTLGALAFAAACNQSGAGGGSVTPETEDQKTYYALGLMMGRNLKQLNIDPRDLEYVKQGLEDQALGRNAQVDLQTYGPKVQKMMMGRQSAADATNAAAQKAKDKPFEENAAKEPGAETLANGLIFKSLTPGKGDSPKATDVVKVNYEGKLTDGTIFDSSYERHQPAQFPLNGVIPCWTEGVQKMKVGETAQLVCPSAIAYGDRGRPPKIPGGATLVFKVELLDIVKNATPPGMPPGMAGMGGHPFQIHSMGHPMPGRPMGTAPARAN